MTFFRKKTANHFRFVLYIRSLLVEQRELGECFLYCLASCSCNVLIHNGEGQLFFFFSWHLRGWLTTARGSEWTVSLGYGRPTFNPVLELNLKLLVLGTYHYHFTNGERTGQDHLGSREVTRDASPDLKFSKEQNSTKTECSWKKISGSSWHEHFLQIQKKHLVKTLVG